MEAKLGIGGDVVHLRSTPGRTAFQTQHTIDTAKREDFAYFNGDPTCEESYRGPFAMLWTDRSGEIHLEWVGQRKVIRVSQTEAHK